jgi:hypothetical protein
MRKEFFRGLLFLKLFCFTQKIKELWLRDFQKYCFFENLGLQ